MHERPVRRAAALIATIATLLTLAAAPLPASAESSYSVSGPQVLRVEAGEAADAPQWAPPGVVDEPATGAVHDGLATTRACTGGYAVEGPADDGHAHRHRAMCSHGPDEAPPGVDVRDQPTVSELRADAAVAAEAEAPGATASSTVACYGDGTSGPRLQAVYAVASDQPDRFASVAALIPGYAATADRAFAASAERDGGVRHLRWVTDSGCTLSVLHVVLSPTGDDSLGNTRAELRTQGLDRSDRKYVVWTDAAVYCGIAYVSGDSRPDESNRANAGPTFSRVDTACWGYSHSVEAHEIAHMLGAVQLDAPNSNGAWHCTDEYDRLCYDDGSGVPLRYPCASTDDPLLDCGGDDYFNVAPAAGSWLATHWNLADSLFLERVEPTVAPTATDPPVRPVPAPVSPATSGPPPVSTADPAPAPPVPPSTDGTKDLLGATLPHRVATSWRAEVPMRGWARTFRFRATAGPLSATVRFAGAGTVRVRVRDDEGRLVVGRLRRSGVRLSTWVPRGRYAVAVHSSMRVSPPLIRLTVARLLR